MKFLFSTFHLFCLVSASVVSAFIAPPAQPLTSSTALNAIGVLAKKAKEADLRKFVADGVSDEIMEYYNRLKANMDSVDLSKQTPGPLQDSLTRRAGTITVIAEYKRKNEYCPDGVIKDIFDPEILSPSFREFGASGIAVLADPRMGGCDYDDLNKFVLEQKRASQEVPGPVPVINSDLIVDELQIARSAACGAAAVLLILDVVEDNLSTLIKATKALDLEAIVAVSSAEEAQAAVDAGARIISVVNVDGADAKVEVIGNLNIPEGEQVCKIANIIARDDKALGEIEECWAVRDKGFQCAWVGDALYKSGLETEAPGAIIKSMKSKSSLKWASPKASHGRGEGAREYLGDILM